MLEILLVRHGQTDWNKNGRIMGARSVPLNATGIRQTEATAEALHGVSVDAIYSSPIKRAIQTARIIARGGRVRVIEAPEWAEMEYGNWVGKTFDEVRHYPAYRTYHLNPKKARVPGGEKMTDVYKRTGLWMEQIRKKFRKGRILVVSHADVIKSSLVRNLRMNLNDMLRITIDNGSVSILWFDGKRFGVSTINGHARLDGVLGGSDQVDPFLTRKRHAK